MKPLKEILKEVNVEEIYGDLDIFIEGITENSKEIKKGFLFVAKKGVKTSGEEFIEEAINNGAIAILKEPPIIPKKDVCQIIVKDVKEEMGKVALNFYDNPEKKLFLIGITGTNGKTSTAFFLKQAFENLGIKAGYIGTICYDIGKRLPSKETTPSIIELAKLLNMIVAHKGRVCVLEVSSHALSQKRLSNLKFEIAGFTNLSRDHLDYHKTMENYYQSKKLLFTSHLVNKGKAVISLETPWGERLAEELKKERKDVEIIFTNYKDFEVLVEGRENGLLLKVKKKNKEWLLKINAIGDFQRFNIGVALAILMSFAKRENLKKSEKEIISAFSNVSPPEGRLELVTTHNKALFVVDYAHTPDALKFSLLGVRPWVKNRLILVFGCGGERDKGKRPLMAKVAEELADIVIVTSDNPRREDPFAIIKDIISGFEKEKPIVIVDRKEAIKEAVKIAQPGDVVLIAGKGHETYQQIGDKRIPFSDKEEVLKAIRNMKEGVRVEYRK